MADDVRKTKLVRWLTDGSKKNQLSNAAGFAERDAKGS